MTHASDQRVSTLELFFDLVFVFTLTQLTGVLAAELTVESAFQAGLIFIVLFWMYGGYVWLTNGVPPDRPQRRLLLIAGMGAFLVCALAIPRAFGGSGLAFGLGYLAVVLVHGAMYGQAFGYGVVARFVPFNIAAALAVIAASAVDGIAVYALWIAAILIQFVTPSIAARVGAVLDIRAAHFVERHGLLMLVALGESIIAIGIGLGDVELDAGLVAVALLGLALAAALWWGYFVGEEGHAERAMAEASPEDRFRLAINAYFFAYVPMLFGILATAAGVKGALGHIGEPLEVGYALLLGGGIALFRAGDVGFRLALGIRPVAPRAVAAGAALGTVVVGVVGTSGLQLVTLVGILVVTQLVEPTPDQAPRS